MLYICLAGLRKKSRFPSQGCCSEVDTNFCNFFNQHDNDSKRLEDDWEVVGGDLRDWFLMETSMLTYFWKH